MTTAISFLRRWMGLFAASVALVFVLQGCASSSNYSREDSAPTGAHDDPPNVARERAGGERVDLEEDKMRFPGAFVEEPAAALPILAPWKTTAFAKDAYFSTDGSRASYDLFVSLLSLKSQPRRMLGVRPQEWVQAAAPVFRDVAKHPSTPRSNLLLSMTTKTLRMPSGRVFVSLSWRLTKAVDIEEQPMLHIVLTDPSVELDVVDVPLPNSPKPKLHTTLTSEVRSLRGAHKVLLVSSSSPQYALVDWQEWSANARTRGVETSFWLAPSKRAHLDKGAISGPGDRVALSDWRKLVNLGGGQLWIGGEGEKVLRAWQDAKTEKVYNPSLQISFSPDVVNRHRIVASYTGQPASRAASWRTNKIFSMLLELELQTKQTDVDAHPFFGDAYISVEATSNDDDTSLFSWRRPLLFDFSPSKQDQEEVARQILFALVAESFHGRKPQRSDVQFIASHLGITAAVLDERTKPARTTSADGTLWRLLWQAAKETDFGRSP